MYLPRPTFLVVALCFFSLSVVRVMSVDVIMTMKTVPSLIVEDDEKRMMALDQLVARIADDKKRRRVNDDAKNPSFYSDVVAPSTMRSNKNKDRHQARETRDHRRPRELQSNPDNKIFCRTAPGDGSFNCIVEPDFPTMGRFTFFRDCVDGGTLRNCTECSVIKECCLDDFNDFSEYCESCDVCSMNTRGTDNWIGFKCFSDECPEVDCSNNCIRPPPPPTTPSPTTPEPLTPFPTPTTSRPRPQFPTTVLETPAPNSPSQIPSQIPSQVPSQVPSLLPSMIPSMSPTTLNPTLAPTPYPTPPLNRPPSTTTSSPVESSIMSDTTQGPTITTTTPADGKSSSNCVSNLEQLSDCFLVNNCNNSTCFNVNNYDIVNDCGELKTEACKDIRCCTACAKAYNGVFDCLMEEGELGFTCEEEEVFECEDDSSGGSGSSVSSLFTILLFATTLVALQVP